MTWRKLLTQYKNQFPYPLDKPLTLEIFTNPENPIVKSLLYVYTMETWLYPELNKASRNKDESKIMLLGPYA